MLTFETKAIIKTNKERNNSNNKKITTTVFAKYLIFHLHSWDKQEQWRTKIMSTANKESGMKSRNWSNQALVNSTSQKKKKNEHKTSFLFFHRS